MERTEIFNKVSSIIDHKIGAYGSLTEEDHIFNDLGWDSLDCIEVIMECEREFDTSIYEKDVENIRTVKEVIDYLETKIK